ncbi:MAG: response regulator [Synergistaceae bacterium]|nr:response regulator [Synergistaceae bacterium]
MPEARMFIDNLKEEAKEEIRKLRAENKKLLRELHYERNINRRNKIIAESRDNLSKIVSAEKDRLEKYMNLLLTNCPDITMFFDREGQIVLASDSYLKSRKIPVFGMIRGKSYRELFPPDMEEDFLQRVDDIFQTALIEKRSIEAECDIDWRHDGNSRHYYIHAIPMIEESGATEGAMFLFYDMTEISKARLEAERAREAAERSNRAKSEFLSRMSHEIRTPMNAILGMTELLLRKEIPSAVREDALGIKYAGSSLLAIINDILDFSKIESGKMDILPVEYDLASLINDVVSVIRMKLLEKPVLFTVNVDSSLPRRLIGDEPRIRQVLLNLLGNAAKYTHSGHIALTADGAPDSDRILLRFAVSDTGIGIKEEDISKLFVDFSQVDTYKNGSLEGTGLGLSIAQSLCRLMDGKITVTSSYGTGSVFTAAIPQKIVDRTPLASVDDAPRKKVLLYEKCQICADSLMRSFDDLGVPCKAVRDAADFRKELETGDYRFVFLSAQTYEEVKKYTHKNSQNSQNSQKNFGAAVIVIADIGKLPALGEVRILAAPPRGTSIANLLNDESDASAYHENSDALIGFTAPAARVLIVDDIPTNLKVAAGLMTPYKMQIDCCESGAETIRLIQENRYDLVLIDHMMPDMDGIDTAEVIRGMPGDYYQNLPLVAFTANAMTGMREMFLEKGFDDYLTKPIEIRKLYAIINKWIPREKRRQGTYKPEPRSPVPRSRLPEGRNVKGIDLSAGKDRFYDEESYLQVLHAYCQHTPALLEKLKDVSEENLKDYAVTVHGIKGSSYGICAAAVGKEAETLELAAKAKDLAVIREKNDAFIETVKELLSDLKRLLSDLGMGAEKNKVEKAVKPSPDKALLETLFSASKKFKLSEMEKALAELERYEYQDDAELIPWLREQVNNLEYEAIQKRLESFT